MATDVLLEPENASYLGGTWTMFADSIWTGATWGKLRGSLRADGLPANTKAFLSFSSATTKCITAKWKWFAAGGLIPFMGFSNGTTPTIRLVHEYASSNYYIRLEKYNGSSWDLLATSSAISNTSFRAEMMIEDHGSSARVRVWLRYWNVSNGPLNYGGPHTLVLDYTGDTSGYDIDGAWISPMTAGPVDMGPLIVSDEATHRFEAFPVAITAAGDVNTMAAGTYADIDEVNADTTDYVESDTADQEILCTAGNLPSSVSAVVAVKLSALASAGSSGPTDALLGVKSGGTENWADTTHTLGAGWENIHRLMQTNPVTTNAWTVSEVNALQYGVKSA